MSTDQIDAWSS